MKDKISCFENLKLLLINLAIKNEGKNATAMLLKKIKKHNKIKANICL